MHRLIFLICGLSIFLSSQQVHSAPQEHYALVTGATRGIGKAVVDELLKRDPSLKIFAVARSQNHLKRLLDEYPSHIIPISADLSHVSDLESIVQTVRHSLGSTGALVYLIHNAARIEPIGELEYLQKEPLSNLAALMETTYKTNVIAPHLLTLALLPELTKTNAARILFVSSVAGDHPVPGAITYSCTKAALDHLARNLKACVEGKIAVGILHPGVVDTDMHATLRTFSVEQFSLSAMMRAAKEKNELISPQVSAQFIVHLLYDMGAEEFSSKKWNLYFTRPAHLPEWLSKAIGHPPHYIKKHVPIVHGASLLTEVKK